MRILGIDPGIAIVGFGVIDSDRGKQSYVRCGVITTPAGTSLSSRLDRIYADMGEVIRTFKPDVAAIEELFSTPTSPPASRWLRAGELYSWPAITRGCRCMSTHRSR